MSVLAPEQQQTAAPPQIVTPPQAAPQPPIAAVPEPAVAPPVGMRPRIFANRKLLVKRFPSLSFGLWTGGLPYWEVFLFTERALIDPKNAARRTPATFYTSRQDGGLRRAQSSGEDTFLVPSAVLRGFAAAVPKPTAIYYTVAAYATPDGAAPVLPEPPEVLAIDAPFVAVSPDFTPDTVSQVLGVHSSRLQVVAQALDNGSAQGPAAVVTPMPAPSTPAPAPVASAPAAPVTPTPGTTVAPPAPQPAAPAPAAPTPTAAAPPVDPVEDAAAGEDGFAYYAAHPEELTPEPPPTLVAVAPQTPANAGASHDTTRGDDVYDDGYGAFDGDWGAEQSWSEVQESPFPGGFSEPQPLVGDDEPGWSDELHGVASRFAYHGLDEPDVAPSTNGGGVAAAPPAPAPPPAAPPSVRVQPLKLTIDDKRSIIEKVAGAESGTDRYGAINADGEYRGRFGPDHPAYHRYHIGLSYGLIQCTQESGNLGRLLVMMRDRNPQAFAQIFGELADQLIATTTADGLPSSQSEDGRSARTQPVGGADLWEDPWISRFRQAGDVVEFQAAQNEYAATTFLDPMLRFAGDLGLDTDRALTMVVDRAVQMGTNGARHWIIAAVGPISTPALRQQALAALGFGDLGSFQQAAGIDADNLWGPVTHAALVAALRLRGSGSPIALPTIDQMLDGMVRRAEADGAFWAPRVKRLRGATGFSDQPYAR